MSQERITFPFRWEDPEFEAAHSPPSRSPRRWCWLDGRFYEREAPTLSLGDFLSATQASACLDVRAFGTEPRHFAAYYQVFLQHVQDMGLTYPPYATQPLMAEAIRDLLNKNRYFGSTLIRLVAFLQYRNDEFGVPTPTTSILIYTDPSSTPLYASTQKQLFMGVYRGTHRIPSDRSHVQQIADPIWWQAKSYMSRMGYSNCFILNPQGHIAAPLHGTLYLLKGERVYTPPISDGALYDPIRQWAPQLVAQVKGRTVLEQSITVEQILDADELFLLSTANGIEGILGVDTKRYRRTYAAALVDPLNRLFFPDQI